MLAVEVEGFMAMIMTMNVQKPQVTHRICVADLRWLEHLRERWEEARKRVEIRVEP